MSRPEIEAKGALKARTMPDGRRKIKLRKAERAALQQRQLIEGAVALFLDLEHGRSWAEIAEELGITVEQLKSLTRTDEFDELYNAMFAEIGHDPRYKAAKAAMADLLPLAIRELKRLITDTGIAGGVRLNAIKEVLRINNIQLQPQPHSDKQEYALFLAQHNIKVEVLPQEYVDAMQAEEGQWEPAEAPLLNPTSEQDEGSDGEAQSP